MLRGVLAASPFPWWVGFDRMGAATVVDSGPSQGGDAAVRLQRSAAVAAVSRGRLIWGQ